jgi:hypothetical protein
VEAHPAALPLDLARYALRAHCLGGMELTSFPTVAPDSVTLRAQRSRGGEAVSEAEREAHRLNAEADRHKQLALEASNVDDRMFHRLMFHLCREAASKTLLAEEDFQLGEQLEEAWEDEEEE